MCIIYNRVPEVEDLKEKYNDKKDKIDKNYVKN